MTTVVFACVHNAGRSQMAAAFFNALADPRKARAISAGTQPASRVHQNVIETMREVGIDLANAVPRRLTPEVASGAGILVTLGCAESCPVVPGARVFDWPLRDPKDEPVALVRQIRDEIHAKVGTLIADEGWQKVD
jgi:arsenate reductase